MKTVGIFHSNRFSSSSTRTRTFAITTEYSTSLDWWDYQQFSFRICLNQAVLSTTCAIWRDPCGKYCRTYRKRNRCGRQYQALSWRRPCWAKARRGLRPSFCAPSKAAADGGRVVRRSTITTVSCTACRIESAFVRRPTRYNSNEPSSRGRTSTSSSISPFGTSKLVNSASYFHIWAWRSL